MQAEQKSKAQDLLDQALCTMKTTGSQAQVAAISVCDEVLETLSKIEAKLLHDVQDGLIEISEQIAEEQTMPNSPERILLDLVAESTKGLNQAISDVFEHHRSVLRYQRNRFVLGKIKRLEGGETTDGWSAQPLIAGNKKGASKRLFIWIFCQASF